MSGLKLSSVLHVPCIKECRTSPATGASANVESKKQEKRLEEVRSCSVLVPPTQSS